MYIDKEEYEKLLEKIEKLENEIELKEDEIYERLDDAKFYFERCEEKDEIIKKIQEENKKLKEKYQSYEELFRQNPIWHINSDNAWRMNPIKNKLEQYKIPINFKKENVYNLEQSDDLKWVSLKYKRDKLKDEDYKIPRSLGEQLEVVDKIDNKIDQNKIKVKKIQSYKDIMDFLKTRKDINNIEYWKKSIDFLRFFRLKEFKKKDFVDYCKYKNRETPRKFLYKMIEFGFIERVKKGNYQKLVNIE